MWTGRDPHTMRRVATIRSQKFIDYLVPFAPVRPVVGLSIADGAASCTEWMPRRTASRGPRFSEICLSARGGPVTPIGFRRGCSVWTCDSGGTVTQVDATSGEVLAIRKFPFDDGCECISAGARSIWISTDAKSEAGRQTLKAL